MSTAAAAVAAYKAGGYEEALRLYDVCLLAHEDKVGFANRAAALGALERHEEAFLDAMKCIQIDWLWPKGYLRKAQALVALGRKVEAIEVLLDAKKVCVAQGSDILKPLTLQLNRELGGYIDDLEVNDRRAKEKWCAHCGHFQADLPASAFVSCTTCKMVNYCCAAHRAENQTKHHDVCPKLVEAHDQLDESIQVLIKWPESDSEMQEFPFKLIARYPQCDNLLLVESGFMFLTRREAMDLNSWDAWFSLPKQRKIFDDFRLMHLSAPSADEFRMMMSSGAWDEMLAKLSPAVAASITPEMLAAQATHTQAAKTPEAAEATRVRIDKTLRRMRRALTEVYTDALTAFFAMRAGSVLGEKFFCAPTSDRTVIELHVVGAEPHVELYSRAAFGLTLRSLFGDKSTHLHIHFVGCLLPFAPDQRQSFEEARVRNPHGLSLTLFGGSYQEFIVSPAYAVPDCIIAFHPGLYDPTYPWLPVVAHAIAKSIPFVVTCFHRQDYETTQALLGGQMYGMNPRVVVDSGGPFASTMWSQPFPGENRAKARNTHVLMIHGGTLGDTIPSIIADDASPVAAQLRIVLSRKGSVFNFDGFRKDLVKLHNAGCLG